MSNEPCKSIHTKGITTRALTYRDYPEELKAAVIAAIKANGGNVLATSKLFNIPRDTVNYWWRNSDRFVEIEQTSAGNLADKLENIAHQAADSIADHDLSIVSYRDKGAVLSTVIDKMQLLRGLPTLISADIERQELVVILQSALAAGLEREAIDVTPEPEK